MRRLTLFMLLFASLGAAQASPLPRAELVHQPDVIKADFADLYRTMAASHFDLYARRSKAEYDALYQATLAGFARPMSDTDVRVAFQVFLAFGRVAHARIDFPSDAYGAYRDSGGKALPLQVHVDHRRIFVVENDGPSPVRAGDEVLGVNGVPATQLLQRLGANISADNDYMLGTLLENRFGPLLWLAFGSLDTYQVTVRDGGGAVRDVPVAAETRAVMRAASAQQSGALSLDWDKREFRLVNGVGYLRPGPFYNNDPNAADIWDTTAFRTFIDGAFSQLLASGARSLVIDLRDNPGGDNSFSDLMVSWFAKTPFRFAKDFRIRVSEAAMASNAKRLAGQANAQDSISLKFADAYARHRPGDVFSFDIPLAQPRAGQRFGGHVFMLVNRHSYSNTVQVGAMAQDMRMATILGEETSDLATTFGAMEQFTLLRTGIEVGFPKAQIIRVNGDMRARGVVPDVVIESPIVEPASDPVLQRALQLAH